MTKHFLKSTAILLTVVIFFAACSKENKIRKNLSGTWKVTSATDSTINADLALGATLQYQFSDCKKTDEPCNGVYTLSISFFGLPLTSSVNYKWSVVKDVLTITPDSTSTLAPGSFHIDFTEKDKVTATDVNKASSSYNLQRQ
ncbi:MAG: hypothetical protein WCI97_08405 [Bacteroidota bacterium]